MVAAARSGGGGEERRRGAVARSSARMIGRSEERRSGCARQWARTVTDLTGASCGDAACSVNRGSTSRCSLRLVSRPSPHGRPSRRSQRLTDKVVVRLLQLGCLEKGRKARETRSEIYQEKIYESGHPI